MSTQTVRTKNSLLVSVYAALKKDAVFTLSLILALISCFFSPPSISYIDFKVLICLFNLMIVIKAFDELHLLDKFAVSILNRCTDSRKVSLLLILLSFFASMLITNDVALITFVPLALIIGNKSGINMIDTVVLQTLAANIGSSLTPMGNPQNLFIFSYYKLAASHFFASVSLFPLLGLAWLVLLNRRNHSVRLSLNLDPVKVDDRIKTSVWAALFAAVVMSIFEVISYKAVFILILAATIIINKKLFSKVDYSLLITFVGFFVFIGNVSAVPLVSSYMKQSLDSGIHTFFSSIALSQFISNVPCSIFLSRFTPHWKELLLGVNIGGMGTLIASLASVISYKLFIKEDPHSGKAYLLRFSAYNLVSLCIFTIIIYFTLIR
ncbi:MAG: Anion permease ArsB/NhaD-like [Firmicutes bacterium]|nr:Anion permease ArsB/NhaD-like [Bacillota bacterium]MDI6705053.1 SLC13 family permease [Bacillota bacterium]